MDFCVCFHFIPRVPWPSFCLPLIVSLCSGVSCQLSSFTLPYKLYSVQCFFVWSRQHYLCGLLKALSSSYLCVSPTTPHHDNNIQLFIFKKRVTSNCNFLIIALVEMGNFQCFSALFFFYSHFLLCESQQWFLHVIIYSITVNLLTCEATSPDSVYLTVLPLTCLVLAFTTKSLVKQATIFCLLWTSDRYSNLILDFVFVAIAVINVHAMFC